MCVDFPLCAARQSLTMSLTNGHIVSKETWDSHNKMMLEPLATNDSEVCAHLPSVLELTESSQVLAFLSDKSGQLIWYFCMCRSLILYLQNLCVLGIWHHKKRETQADVRSGAHRIWELCQQSCSGGSGFLYEQQVFWRIPWSEVQQLFR